jgi:hypothetical protein
VLALCAGCGKKLGPGKTPKETIRNFEAALKDLDLEATYDMLSARVRGEIDAALNGMKAALNGVPDSVLEKAGLDDLKDMEPREMLGMAMDKAKEFNPQAIDQLKTLQMIVLEVKTYGERGRVKVSTIFQGREETNTVPMVLEGGLWRIDSDESLSAVPMDFSNAIQACATPT